MLVFVKRNFIYYYYMLLIFVFWLVSYNIFEIRYKILVCICLIFFDIYVILFLVLIVECEFLMKIYVVKFLIFMFCIVSIEYLRCIMVEDRRDLMFFMYDRLLILTERS